LQRLSESQLVDKIDGLQMSGNLWIHLDYCHFMNGSHDGRSLE
jgi:hypothetical protein